MIKAMMKGSSTRGRSWIKKSMKLVFRLLSTTPSTDLDISRNIWMPEGE